VSGIAIVVVEDEREVRDAVVRDLAPFTSHFRIEVAEDVADAKSLLAELAGEDVATGLILCDHLLPGVLGIDFLIELQGDAEYRSTRKVLLTGQAGLEDTIRAVNEANLDHYVAKPWAPEELHRVVRSQLTEYVVTSDGDVLPYVSILDGPRLLDAASERGWEGRAT
jgi:two-component system phosphate regulon response regulator PhoB